MLHRPEYTHGLVGSAVGRGGTLWLGQRAGVTNLWHALEARTGRYLGRLSLPVRQDVATGTIEHVWILERDSLDVEYLVKRRVTAR